MASVINAELMIASAPEKAVYYALVRLGEPFKFQTKMMGGRDIKGGVILDFVLRQYSLVISVIGWYYHNRPEAKARDRIQRIALASKGLRVIYIDEQDALDNARYYVKRAIRGIDDSRYKYLV